MTPLDDLAAKVPAVAHYHIRTVGIPTKTPREADAVLALTAVAEYVARLEESRSMFKDYADSADRQCERERQRAEQAEAEVERLRWMLADYIEREKAPEFVADELADLTARWEARDHD